MVLDTEPTLTVGQRLVRVLDDLGLPQAHLLMRNPRDVVDLVGQAPGRIASITQQGATGDPRALVPFLDRTLWILGDAGAEVQPFAHHLAALAGANVRWLRGYTQLGWSDTAADCTTAVAAAVLAFLAQRDAVAPPPPATLAGAGTIAGVSYQAAGSGTPVVLLPLGLAPQQWEPLLPLLQARHCTIVLGGRYLSPISFLEDRAAGHYSRMALDCLDLAEPQAEEALIEIGCGTGALLRGIAQRFGLARVAGLDINRFLLREARALADAAGLAEQLEFHEGSAEAIPFPNATFDLVCSSTVLEEVDADRALAEMVRITKPGGRVVVVVRAMDLRFWTNLPLPEGVAEKMLAPAGGVSASGCADGSLLRRLGAAGLQGVRGGPVWSWHQDGMPGWAVAEAASARLLADEAESWRAALVAAAAEGVPAVLGRPHHCALGVKWRAP
ncbi:MAG TPA: class I SAM-dependent methyltransferase [Ktedonobacterales bacterium]|nr:class I SAM-dependent methyltransferase [Ktedonobacterales bacterium]